MAALSKWVPIGDATDQPETNTVKPLKLTTIDKIGGIFCHICKTTFGNKKEYDTHYVNHGLGSADIVYTCVVCHKEITGYPSFRGHCYLKHVVKDKFKCEHCEKVFSKHCVLNSHIKAVHQFRCGTCDNKFQNQKELLMHQVIHKNDQGPPYNCSTCNQQMDTADDCEQHVEDHCLMTYNCPICDETIDDLQNTASHLTKHFGNVLSNDQTDENDEEEPAIVKNDSSIDLLGGIFCCYCEQIFKARPEFDSHFSLEHEDKSIVYACNICAKEFEKYFLFANHCYDHYAKGRFQCDECFKCFPRLSLLVSHVEAAHVAGQLSCACGRGFESARRLRDHAASHRPPIACPHPACPLQFPTLKELRAHSGAHAAHGAHGVARGAARCGACGLRLGSAAAAARHAPLHRKPRFRCPVCARAYAEKYRVMRHVNTHFCSVLHICNICGKVYNARARLNNHMKVHNEVKDHKCTYCGKGFTKIYLLKQHLNIHTGLRPYVCTVCTKTFAGQPNLIKHMKCMHNITKIDMKLCYNPNPVTKIPNPRANTKIEKLDTVGMFNENDLKQELNVHNSNAVVNVEPESLPVLEVPPEIYDEGLEGGWKSEHMDPSVLDMLEENISVDAISGGSHITELENALWVQSPTMPTESPTSFLAAAGVPREYGPDFVSPHDAHDPPPGACIHLDDPPLPHMDPRLALRDPRAPPAPPAPPPPPPRASPPPPPRWEPPIFTKLPEYQFAEFPDARYSYSMINTDIF